ncbi:ribosome-associated translation inhibitor RaiA [Venenivibrio stagnispumantis]|uniref:Ribosome hibernation promoting factor n=1 Tax=Venenivibrio stagnispumantis TaxID=407998 RepID=A0AA46AF01_9AQUI|nr:ribosome-associated translation inhibitor RaiA [Venenivibrio stagnispumantis]MCW4573705.1 ribosome-associated translation inhibitor RaiA [Venenivibrio stagnispumantis]SMP16066.1 putative sigma-54 modulation protein [Venenivibrio stagnispumantis]
MQIEHVGKNIDVTDFIKAYTEHRLERIKRYIKDLDVSEDSVRVRVVYDFEKHRHRNRVDIDIYFNTPGGGVIHAWEESNDLYSAIDFAMDEVERQLIRLKSRRVEEKRRAAKLESLKEHTAETPSIERPLITLEPLPVEKPMTVEDARLLLEEMGTFFLPFRNAETGEINVIYRKKAGNYGLIASNV